MKENVRMLFMKQVYQILYLILKKIKEKNLDQINMIYEHWCENLNF